MPREKTLLERIENLHPINPNGMTERELLWQIIIELKKLNKEK